MREPRVRPATWPHPRAPRAGRAPFAWPQSARAACICKPAKEPIRSFGQRAQQFPLDAGECDGCRPTSARRAGEDHSGRSHRHRRRRVAFVGKLGRDLRSGKCKQPTRGGRAGEDRAAGRASRDDRPRGSLCKVLEIVIKIDFRCGQLRRAVSRVPATLGLLEAHHEKLQLINAGIRVRTVPRARRTAASRVARYRRAPLSTHTAVLTGMPQKRVPSSHARLPALTP